MKTTQAIGNYLALLFQNTAWGNIGDASGLQPSATTGSLYVSLHTADPGASGNQTTNEAAYTGYARVAVARSSSGWTISGDSVSNTGAITFPQCTGGSETETHYGIGTASSGTGHLLYYGPLTSVFYGFTAETSGNISVVGSSFSNNDRVAFYPNSTDYGLPTGITEGTLYYVVSVTGDVITVSASSGGSPITISAAGAGTAAKVTPFAVSNTVTPQMSAGQCVVLEF